MDKSQGAFLPIKPKWKLRDWILAVFSYIVIYSILMIPMIEFSLVQSFASQMIAVSLSIVGAVKLKGLGRKPGASRNIYIVGTVIYILIIVYMTFRFTN